MFKISRFKQIIFRKYATNLKTIISDRSLGISDFLLLYFFFAFLIDLIDNIISFSPYSPYYVTRTSANGKVVYWSRDFRIVQCLRFSGFFPYHPFIFPLQSHYVHII